MRILHTSDWHVGRTFHREPTLEHLRTVLAALADLVLAHRVDVVAVSGDIFDVASPSGDAYAVLKDALARLHATGATVVLSHGNHDSAKRLSFGADWAALADIHISANPEHPVLPVEVRDEHGSVWFYPVPYLDPALLRHLEGAEHMRTHEDALEWALAQVREDAAARGATRTVVLAHCFAAGVPTGLGAADTERDLTAGGLDVVPLGLFDGFDYVALGHIHSRARLSERVRYSGAPLYYSFSEVGKPRGVWLVDLDAGGFAGAQWLELPVPRGLSVLRGELDTLLTSPEHSSAEDDWVSVTLTDATRPLDAMPKLRARFPHAVHLEYAPPQVEHAQVSATPQRIKQDLEQTVREFLTYVRGQAPGSDELTEIHDLVSDYHAQEAQR